MAKIAGSAGRPSDPRRCRRFWVFLALLAPGLVAGAQPESVPELRTAEAVRQLSPQQSQQHLPVRLRGVVTFFDETLFSRFIQDETAGIYLQFSRKLAPPRLQPGQVVEITGTTSPGEYAPVVAPDSVRVVGQEPLPAAKRVTYEQLASGVEDSQFVEITGIVRSVRPLTDTHYSLIDLATGGGRLLVYANSLPVRRPEELLDSSVRVRGVCSTKFNRKRQLFAIRLMVPRPEDLELEQAAPADPFAIEARPIGSLLQFSPQNTYGHRVKVVGTVTYFAPGSVLFLQDGEQGVEVQTRKREPVQLGDRVEVLGFVSQGVYTPVLEDSVYRKIAPGTAPAPDAITPDEALMGNYDCHLVRMMGRVLDRAQDGDSRYLILQDSNCVFHADLPQFQGQDGFARLENGSRVAVTGVCRIDPGEWRAGTTWRAKGFRIELRSPEDIALLAAPPWWSLTRVLWMAGGLGLVSLAALGWVGVLRRQVAERTLQLEVQIHERQLAERRQEIEEERARVAHDLHDDLGAGLTEVNMLSSLARSPATSPVEKERYLGQLTETARRMVTSLDEIVWAVSPRNDTIASLASYFSSYAQGLLELAGVACGLEIAEEMPEYPLDPKFRQELFFAFKEALTNVVRHARASQVWLRIAVRDACLHIEVADNGCGFLPGKAPAGRDGLANMKERLKTVGGECSVASAPQQGTTVRFSAPLPERLL